MCTSPLLHTEHATHILRSPSLPQEGEEPDSFWAALGGKAAYASSSSRRHVSGPALLLHLRDAAGRGLKVDVYSVFSQEHLVGDDVLLLDTGAEVGGGAGRAGREGRAVRLLSREAAAPWGSWVGDQVLWLDKGAER